MLRYKLINGDSLRLKKPGAQVKEGMIGVRVINRMTVLGRPESAKIVA